MALFQRFTNVRREEVGAVVAAAVLFFCILTALMVVRPARESLGMRSGIETVRWLFNGTLVVTLLANPVFGLLVSRYRRLIFISTTYLFFAASLAIFWALLVLAPQAVGEASGMVFFVWFSVFNLFVTMVFWGLMADRFTLEQSKRLFGIIAVGGTLGAIFGPWLASRLAEPLGTPSLLLVAVAFLMLAVGAAWVVARIQPDRAAQTTESTPVGNEHAVIGGSAWQGFRAVVGSRYLIGIAAYALILAVMATYIYFTRLQMVAAMTDDLDTQTAVFAQIDLYVQITTLVLQAVVAGHLMRWLGVPITLALLPATVMLGFIGLAIVASFSALVILQSAFNAIQRAIMRPARETLFTVISREDKYKSKAFIDTFVYRGGDAVGAQTEGLLGNLGMGVTALAVVAVPLSIVWGGLGIYLGRSQKLQAKRIQP